MGCNPRPGVLWLKVTLLLPRHLLQSGPYLIEHGPRCQSRENAEAAALICRRRAPKPVRSVSHSMSLTITNSPTHEEISHRAQKIWSSRGSPSGCDTEIWYEAERQLSVESPESEGSGSPQSNSSSGRSERAAGPLHGGETPAPSPDDTAAKVAVQKSAARAPQHQHGNKAWKPAPPESGKPLWDKPHSS